MLYAKVSSSHILRPPLFLHNCYTSCVYYESHELIGAA